MAVDHNSLYIGDLGREPTPEDLDSVYDLMASDMDVLEKLSAAGEMLRFGADIEPVEPGPIQAAQPRQPGTSLSPQEIRTLSNLERARASNDDEEPSWEDFANCLGVDPDLFFPERGASTREAKAVCRGCVVREDCLEEALENHEKFGIWGGTSERERRQLRRQRALARRANEASGVETTAVD